MTDVEVDLDRLPVRGSVNTSRSESGITFHRLPEWARGQLLDPAFGLVEAMPAGVRFEFRTDARALELDVNVTQVQIGDQPPLPAAFDLVVDGALEISKPATSSTLLLVDPETREMTVTAGVMSTLRFDLPGEVESHVELWLPHVALVKVQGVRISSGELVDATASPRPRWIHYGSSISHCAEAPSPTQTWPALVARELGLDLLDLAFAGQCQLDQQVARTIRDEAADVISMKVGINVVNGDTMRERTFVPTLHGFLDIVRDGHPHTPIVVITPIICPDAEAHPGPTRAEANGRYTVVDRPEELGLGALTLQRIRVLVAAVVDQRRNAGDANLHLIDGLSLFGAADISHLHDGLHPDAAGYRLIAERFCANVPLHALMR